MKAPRQLLVLLLLFLPHLLVLHVLFRLPLCSAIVRVSLKARRRRNLSRDNTTPATDTTMPTDPTSFNPSGGHATVALDQRRQSQYLGQVAFGDPPQTFNVLWDTGSSNTWIWSRRCETHACTSKNRFDDDLSKDYRSIDDQVISVRYGSGSIDADMGTDTVTIGAGRHGESSIIVHDQTFGQVFDETGMAFDITDMDGIIGLAFPSMSPTGADPIFDTMMHQGLLERPIFSFAFYGKAPSATENTDPEHRVAADTADSHDATGAAAVLTFGGYDAHRFMGDLVPVSVQGTRYWEVKMLRITVDGRPVLGICDGPGQDGCKVAVDSGTSGITAPSGDLGVLNRALRIDPRCTNFDSLPVLTFEMARAGTSGERPEDVVSLALQPVDYVQRRTAAGWGGLDSDICSSVALALDVPAPRGPLWVLGDAFLRVYYTVFDRGAHTVSFARMAAERQAEETKQVDSAGGETAPASKIIRSLPLLRGNGN